LTNQIEKNSYRLFKKWEFTFSKKFIIFKLNRSTFVRWKIDQQKKDSIEINNSKDSHFNLIESQNQLDNRQLNQSECK
jgi:hypothetical protein